MAATTSKWVTTSSRGAMTAFSPIERRKHGGSVIVPNHPLRHRCDESWANSSTSRSPIAILRSRGCAQSRPQSSQAAAKRTRHLLAQQLFASAVPSGRLTQTRSGDGDTSGRALSAVHQSRSTSAGYRTSSDGVSRPPSSRRSRIGRGRLIPRRISDSRAQNVRCYSRVAVPAPERAFGAPRHEVCRSVGR